MKRTNGIPTKGFDTKKTNKCGLHDFFQPWIWVYRFFLFYFAHGNVIPYSLSYRQKAITK